MSGSSVDPSAPISGHVYLREGKLRSGWYAKWRDHSGQHQKRLGPAWTGKSAPVPGTFRKREAQAALDELLVDARKGARRQERTGVTFADVADDWFERGRFERDWSASTQVDYRSVLDTHLIRAFGSRRIETITSEDIQKWRDKFARETDADGEPLRARKTVNKIVTQLHAVFEHALDHHGLVFNPVSKVKRLRESNDPDRYDFFAPEEIDLLVATAAAASTATPTAPRSPRPSKRCAPSRTSKTPRST